MKELLLEKCPDRHMEVAASNKEWSCLYFHLSPFNMVENLEYCFGRDSQGFSAILRTKVLESTTRIPFVFWFYVNGQGGMLH